MAKKYAQATLHSSDLSLGIYCICSQSHTIPLTWAVNFQSSQFESALQPVNHFYRLHHGFKIGAADYSKNPKSSLLAVTRIVPLFPLHFSKIMNDVVYIIQRNCHCGNSGNSCCSLQQESLNKFEQFWGNEVALKSGTHIEQESKNKKPSQGKNLSLLSL